jgi:hypothetical protein
MRKPAEVGHRGAFDGSKVAAPSDTALDAKFSNQDSAPVKN